MKYRKKLNSIRRDIRRLELEYAQTVYDGMIMPFMQRYGLTIKYGMGYVWFEKNGENWSDRRYRSVSSLYRKIDTACENIERFAATDKCGAIWWIVQLLDPNKEQT